MKLLAIDPGNTESAWVLYDTSEQVPLAFDKMPNEMLMFDVLDHFNGQGDVDRLAIEMVASYGMPVGREVFETCVWIGRFAERWGGDPRFVYRLDVKKHLCKTGRHVTDANIRAALIDKWGPGKERAVGLKNTPGPLYGMKGDEWSALAVAVTAAETEELVTA